MTLKKIAFRIGIPIIIIGIFFTLFIYNSLFSSYVEKDLHQKYLFISTNATFQDVKNSLLNEGFVKDISLFSKVARWKDYDKNIKAGRYEIQASQSVWSLVKKLKSGEQSPVRLTFNNIRFTEKLAGILGSKLEIDSTSFMDAMNNSQLLADYGFSLETRNCMFLPNTYEFYWNISLKDFLDKMLKEYKKYWTQERIDKAAKIGLTELEVSILASIVQEETNKKDEMSRIAGVYLNRLKKGMLLQADPTARYAYGDFNVKRIIGSYLTIDSPYNTYKYKGLPPGPICMPEPIAIDKVLNAEQHSYFYFCAKADGSGYHSFASSHDEHINNARAYHRYLNSKGIR